MSLMGSSSTMLNITMNRYVCFGCAFFIYHYFIRIYDLQIKNLEFVFFIIRLVFNHCRCLT